MTRGNQPARTVARTSAYDQKLGNVLRIGARVIAREGYGRATIRQVSRETGMSLAGLYHYFSSKEELLYLIQFHSFDSIHASLLAKLEEVADPCARLRVMVRNHFDYFLSHLSELRVCAREMESLSGEYYDGVRTLRQDYLRTTSEIVQSLPRVSGDSARNPRLATMFLFGMLNWIYMWHPTDDGVSGEELTDELVGLFLEGYLPNDFTASTHQEKVEK